MKFQIGLILLALFNTPQLWACRMLPLQKNVDKYVYDWVKDTPDIYLAEATAFSKEDESVNFKVKEVIKGEKRTELSVVGSLGESKAGDYSLHHKNIFWDSILEGRTIYDTNCRFNPVFEIGKTYLILLKEPYQAKSFELIKSKSDWWYFRVKEINTLKKYRHMIINKDQPEKS